MFLFIAIVKRKDLEVKKNTKWMFRVSNNNTSNVKCNTDLVAKKQLHHFCLNFACFTT